ncbi:MAG: DUF447 family protein [Hyphomicrobiales bacterium]|nr:DUF447 family protein [Hyphomicrobiales bacterium]
MPYIHETIIVTQTPEGEPHIAPLGLIQDGDEWIAAPFKPTRTLDNLRAHPLFTASVTDDVRVFAGCLTGRKDWPLAPAERIAGARLADAVAHYEFEVERVSEDEQRPRFHARVVHTASHRAAPGFNRAQAAVIELAILTSRLHMLREDKIRREIEYLQIAVSKTAGPREEEAWGWLMARVEAHLAAS